MKTGAFIAATATALAIITAPTQVAAAECSTLTLVVTLLPLLTDANTCSANTGYSLYPFAGLPTAAELALICADSTCTKVLSEAAALNLPDCTVTYNGVAYNVKDQLTAFALLPLSPQAGLCAVDSDYKLYPFEGMPSLDQLRVMCKSDTCKKLLTEAQDGEMPDCEVTINGTTHNVKQSVDLIVAGCEVIDINLIAS
ncbi:hypothetical protein BBO99_00005336 [Phytophthora kernoviae]|uniref:Elicitin n=1 Tax=Phytophthora kernoviae TaxID=325452 RepID=A0A3R7JTJ7_9STRA|nr:hypothetical protein JM16_003269 [Phytophthora kernoviae]RLN21637.1 hypothetical protein BBI17_003594 [Phytophthora kernoviae]RLN79330.1 hypothetical protein BBO99_00005336 [Phytophthora kernoviae]